MTDTDRLRYWIRNGPLGDEGLGGLCLAFWVWWRTWATIGLLGFGFATALWVATVTSDATTALVAFFLGALVDGWLDRVSWGGDA